MMPLFWLYWELWGNFLKHLCGIWRAKQTTQSNIVYVDFKRRNVEVRKSDRIRIR